MERRSNEHGPRDDDELKQRTQGLQQGAPVEPRVQEKEPTADGEPAPGSRVQAVQDGTSPLSPEDVKARSEMARFLSPGLFPATRTQLLADATLNNATEAVLRLLTDLPEGRPFANVNEAWSALGGPTEQRF